jgi:hypothetical protein
MSCGTKRILCNHIVYTLKITKRMLTILQLYHYLFHTNENKMAQVANKVCDICMRTSGPHYCIQCDQLFCADCKMSHLRSKISKSHIFWSGTNISTRCTDHAEDFIYLCADCDQLICRVCVTNAHTRHG